MGPNGGKNRFEESAALAPIRLLTDARLDFAAPVPLAKSYIVAASDRYSSSFLCKSLWQTGRFGAPWDYLTASSKQMGGTLSQPADGSVVSAMRSRLDVRTPQDYVQKLLACRTSRNGVFGLKTRFREFNSALSEIPDLLKVLTPLTYVYVDRRDKLAQAVAGARALVGGREAASVTQPPEAGSFRYDRDLISRLLGRLERNRLDWWRWFEAKSIEPFVIYYEDANADIAAPIRAVGELLGVQDDVADEVALPSFTGDHGVTTDEWAVRFAREIESGIDAREAGGERPSIVALDHAKTSEPRHADIPPKVRRLEQQPGYSALADIKRLPRYEEVIGRNRQLLDGASVLDLISGNGLCSLAALRAGAAYVVGVDPRAARITAAQNSLAACGVPESSCRFVNMEIAAALADTTPESFDVIIGRNVLEFVDVRRFFTQLRRLRPRHVILDGAIAPGKGPLVRFSSRNDGSGFRTQAANRHAVMATPNHDLIVLLCDYFGFRWRLSSDADSGATDWPAGRQLRSLRTYVLDRMA